MKKFIRILATAAVTVAMATTAFAWGPASGPANNNPGAARTEIENLAVRIGGNGNSARITVYDNGTAIYVTGRPANNVYNRVALPGDFEGYVLGVFVRGNSILRVKVIERPEVEVPYVPTIVSEVTTRDLVDLYPIASIYLRTTEVAGSRNLTGLSVGPVIGEANFSHIDESVATGSGVNVGFNASGILNFQNVSTYLEQFYGIYQYVTVTTWSNGETETVYGVPFTDSGSIHTGYEYDAEPVDASRAIDVTVGSVSLARGGGQGYPRSSYVSGGGFTVYLYLVNQSPVVTATLSSYNVNAL